VSKRRRQGTALYSLGLARRELEQTAKAARRVRSGNRLRPGDPEPRAALATSSLIARKGRRAHWRKYRRVLELSPTYSPALVSMASILNAQHKRRDAEHALRQAIQFDPEYIRAHSALGLFLLSDKRWQERVPNSTGYYSVPGTCGRPISTSGVWRTGRKTTTRRLMHTRRR